MESRFIPASRLVIVGVLVILAIDCRAQDRYEALRNWDQAVISAATTTAGAGYMSEDEKELLYLINLMRLRPSLFSQTFLKQYLDTAKRQYSKKYVATLKADLRKSPSLKALKPDETLYRLAEKHALDMGKTGKTGHSSSRGVSPQERFAPVRSNYSMMGENAQYGSSVPLVILMELLIDDGVSNLQHRKNLLEPGFTLLGTATRPHKKFGYNNVMDFGAGR